MEILLLLCMLRISNKYSNEEYTPSFSIDVFIQVLHIIIFIVISFSLIRNDNFVFKFFFFINILIIFYKIKELILDIIFNHKENKNTNGDNNKEER